MGVPQPYKKDPGQIAPQEGKLWPMCVHITGCCATILQNAMSLAWSDILEKFKNPESIVWYDLAWE